MFWLSAMRACPILMIWLLLDVCDMMTMCESTCSLILVNCSACVGF